MAQMAMKAHGDTLLVWKGGLTISDDGITQPLRSAWLCADGSLDSASTPPTEPRMKMSLIADFRHRNRG